MASKISAISSNICSASALFKSQNVLSNQIRTMAHNPKWMRDKAASEAKLQSVRARLLDGTFVKKMTPGEKRKSRLYAPHHLGPAVSGSVNHMPEKSVQSWVFNLKKERVAITDLQAKVFSTDVRQDILHRVMVWQLARRRRGTHQSLNRTTISGTGKKPFAQKGSGRARASTLRSPLHYHGARAFPRRPRDYDYAIPVGFRRKALTMALSTKHQEGNLIVLDAAKADSHKTGTIKEQFEAFSHKKTLVIMGDYEEDPNFVLGTRNLHKLITVLPARGANVYDLIRHRTVFVTLQALKDLETRVSRIHSARTIKFPGTPMQLLDEPRVVVKSANL